MRLVTRSDLENLRRALLTRRRLRLRVDAMRARRHAISSSTTLKRICKISSVSFIVGCDEVAGSMS